MKRSVLLAVAVALILPLTLVPIYLIWGRKIESTPERRQ